MMGTIALLAPSAVADLDLARGEVMAQNLSAGLAVLLIVAYGLALLFSLKTHKELFASADHGDKEEAPWPLGLAVGTLLVLQKQGFVFPKFFPSLVGRGNVPMAAVCPSR